MLKLNRAGGEFRYVEPCMGRGAGAKRYERGNTEEILRKSFKLRSASRVSPVQFLICNKNASTFLSTVTGNQRALGALERHLRFCYTISPTIVLVSHIWVYPRRVNS